MFVISDEKFNQALEKAEKDYKAIIKVKCPYLNNEDVHFNSEGFQHIFYKRGSIKREKSDQYIRLCLLPLAKKVISRSHTLQQFYEENRFERVQSNSQWKSEMKLVKYYAFIAIINNALIKIIVKEIQGRNKNFYSIIPKWHVNAKNGEKKKVLHTGNPEED
jgi:hypothetical protein